MQKKTGVAGKNPNTAGKQASKARAMEECLQSLQKELAISVAGMLGEDHSSTCWSFLCGIKKYYKVYLL